MTDRQASSRAATRDHLPRDRLSLVRRWWNGFLDAGAPWIFVSSSESRAVQLLRQNLSPNQREQFDKDRFFDVIGGSTGTRYRIHQGYQMNVEQLTATGKRARVLCFMPRGQLPVADIMLAQKLALELFEDEAIAVANKILADPRRFGLPSRYYDPISG